METKTIELTETQIDNIRQAGVQRGLNASIKLVEIIRDLHKQSSPEWNALVYALGALRNITIEQAEEV
jgi:hypothetical protein